MAANETKEEHRVLNRTRRNVFYTLVWRGCRVVSIWIERFEESGAVLEMKLKEGFEVVLQVIARYTQEVSPTDFEALKEVFKRKTMDIPPSQVKGQHSLF